MTGVTSITTKPADVDIRGKIGRHIPMEITGKVHPFKTNLFVDLKASLRDFNLSPLTPYSGTYAGYKIEKGSLSFDLKYLINGTKLDAENKVVIDQLTLGDRVDSPEATKLPVGLAIVLLRDSEGKINLDIPVTGRTRRSGVQRLAHRPAGHRQHPHEGGHGSLCPAGVPLRGR